MRKKNKIDKPTLELDHGSLSNLDSKAILKIAPSSSYDREHKADVDIALRHTSDEIPFSRDIKSISTSDGDGYSNIAIAETLLQAKDDILY